MIKISVRDIGSKGMDLDQSVPMESIGLSNEEMDIRSPLHITAHVERVDDFIVANAKVEAEVGHMCARCLKDLQSKEEYPFTFDFETASCGEYIDLGEEIRQEMIMVNPPRVLCMPTCKGICPECGTNLNEEQCKCRK